MSRIGKLPIAIPEGVSITVSDKNLVTVKGKIGTLEQQVNPDIKIEIKEQQVLVSRPTDQKRHRALHGLYRSLVVNMVEGVSKGFETHQELVGVGYRAALSGQILELHLGFSHPIYFEIPKEVKIEVKAEKRGNSFVNLLCADKQLVGHVAAKIRSFRRPEPYKGKGIRFVGEELRRKAGKAASSV